MQTTYNSKTGKIKITLSNLEVRQLRSSAPEFVGSVIKKDIEQTISIVEKKIQ